MKHELVKLEFEYDGLEPFMDAKTVEIHYTKHHQGYCDKFNAALQNAPMEFQDLGAEEVIARLNELPEEIRGPIRNVGGGYVNHNLFWNIIGKDVAISSSFASVLSNAFGSVEAFKEEFSSAALSVFGSGWAWLVVTKDGKLAIRKTANQESPLSDGEIPVLTIDVWEHAYYLKYQNRRPEFVEQFFNLINWDKVEELYNSALE